MSVAALQRYSSQLTDPLAPDFSSLLRTDSPSASICIEKLDKPELLLDRDLRELAMPGKDIEQVFLVDDV